MSAQHSTSGLQRISNRPTPRVVTVAISGCSSSGKTTLAVILADVFARIGNCQNAQVSLEDFLHDKTTLTEKEIPVVIHEDAFFKDKSYCPIATFQSSPADVKLITRTLAHDKIKQYNILYGDCQLLGSNSSNDDSSSPNVLKCSPCTPFWYVTGPDTDCWPALDIPRLTEAIQHVRETGSLSDACIRAYHDTAITMPGLLITAAEREAIVTQHADLITAMKDVVREWAEMRATTNVDSPSSSRARHAGAGKGNEVSHPDLCFIEGFLLLPTPSTALILQNIGSESSKENTPLSKPLLGNPPNEIRSSKRHSGFAIVEAKKMAFQASNVKARSKIMEHFDITLFLPTSKEQAKQRRFIRDCYIDAPMGQRYSGQLWKTEGYFHDIVWGNHVKEHGWLFQDGLVEGSIHTRAPRAEKSDRERECAEQVDEAASEENKKIDIDVCTPSEEAKKYGVHIRPTIDAPIQETVEWAVQTILSELGKRIWVTRSEPDLSVAVKPLTEQPGHDDGHTQVAVMLTQGDNRAEKMKPSWKGCFCF